MSQHDLPDLRNLELPVVQRFQTLEALEALIPARVGLNCRSKSGHVTYDMHQPARTDIFF
jgi:hypothetical protein